MEPRKLESAISKVQTPAFIYDICVFEERIETIKKILGEGIDLCFSIKANPLMTKYIAPMVDYLEVCSPGELSLCKAYRIPPEKIILSGVNKTREDILDAYTYGVSLYTAESPRQAELLSLVAKQEQTTLQVLPRLSAGTQFGMSAADLKETIQHPDWKQHLNFTGIHYFAGTQRKHARFVTQDLEILESLKQELRQECGVDISRIEYGPGLSVPYFTNENFDDTLSSLKAVSTALQEFGKQTMLTVEMGRFLAAEGGVYCTRVADIKKIDDINYAILDGGIHHLNYYGQTMAMKVPVITHIPGTPSRDSGKTADWCLCGSLCTTADILVRNVELTGLEIGDTLIFHYAGAYSNTEGIYLFLSRAMPAVYLWDETGHMTLLRDTKETYTLNMEDA